MLALRKVEKPDMTLLEEFQNDAAGAGIIRDWLGDGGSPVEKALADSRASICITCPKHRPIKWWEIAKTSLADSMRAMLSVKSLTRIKVDNEGELFMCAHCGCCLRLKVHVPIKHIAKHTDSDVMQGYPAHCWVVSEASNEP